MHSDDVPSSQPFDTFAAGTGRGKRLKRGARGLIGKTVGRLSRSGWKARTALALTSVIVLSAAASTVAVASLDDLDDLEAARTQPIRMEDSTGEPIFTGSQRHADHATLDRIPDHLEQAVIAIEDQRFRSHGGLDFRSISRAFWANAAAGKIVQGGSTITQQLVKITYLAPERTYSRKLHEALLTREMEARHTKDEILETYLNRIYLGSGAYGVQSAAQVYFGKSVEELTLAESAILAAGIKAPSVLNLRSDAEAARSRGQLVIRVMHRAGMIDDAEANAAQADLMVMRPASGENSPYGGWFADVVKGQAETFAERFTDPQSLRTTLDPQLQRMAENAVQSHLAGLPTEGALVALRPDGGVVALVGGKDYDASQFNRATQAQRQPGSTFKTFVYLTALAEGYAPDSRISDRPVDIDGYAPENFDGRFHGDVTLASAFARSLNAATVNMAMDIGIDKVAETARLLGVNEELSETPSLALGASGLSLLDLTEAYGAIATGRAPFKAHFVEGITAGADQGYYPFDWDLPEPSGRTAELLAHRDAMTAMLRGVVTDGTGSAVAEVPGAVGKTGTSQNFRDALFVGWTGDLIVGVWVGNDDNSPMDEVTGGALPAEIWAEFQRAARQAPKLPDDAMVASAADLPEELADVRPKRRVAEEGAVAFVQPRQNDALGAALARLEDNGVLTERDVAPLRAALQERLRTSDNASVREIVIQSIADTGPAASQCNVRACDRAFRSFRASDCTYQPYGGGPRQLCTDDLLR